MVLIYTSYFSNPRLANLGLPLYSIARGTPFWCNGVIRLPELAPSAALLVWWKASAKDYPAQEIYVKQYYQETLNQLNPLDIVSKIGSNVVLLCWEKDSFCHRHIVAQWLSTNCSNVSVIEL
jgi:hypothetical protein